MVFTWAFNSVYPLVDSTSVMLADQHGNEYSYVMLWSQVAVTVGPFISGFLVTEADDDAVGKKCLYKNILLYYCNG